MGLAILILFLLVLCSRGSEEKQKVDVEEPGGLSLVSIVPGGGPSDNINVPTFETKDAQLVVTPTELSLDNVVLGAQAEGILEEMNYRVRHARRLPLCGNER